MAGTSPDRLWTGVNESTLAVYESGRVIVPKAYVTHRVDRAALLALLAQAPMEFTPAAANPVTMSLPMPDGTFQRFRVEEAPIVTPGPDGPSLTERAYRGQGIDDPTATVRFLVVPKAFHAIILSASGTTYIDPYSDSDSEHVISYRKRDFVTSKAFTCQIDGESTTAPSSLPPIAPNFTDKERGKEFRNHRLAMAANGEYTAFHHGRPNPESTAKRSAWIKGILPTMVRVNGIYERELSIRMTLLPEATQFLIIYDNAATDPYTNGAADLGTNQTNLDAVIGNANYDVGHVFSTGTGGIATLRSTCINAIKARGTTGTSSPTGDPFDVDYVAHELGHQYGGSHTFNGTAETCGTQRSANAAMEPGSGSTIQAYAGICSPQNIQPNSDDYFHWISLEEMSNHTQGAGDCAAVTPTFNTPPVVNAGPGYTIPKLTPFTLTPTSVTDVDDPTGASLTYCWEEVDLGPANDGTADNGSSPIFRSFRPSSSPSRTFPRISDIVANRTTYGELLPVTDRTMKFSLTVRDNDVDGGAINDGGAAAFNGDVLIDVDPTRGPFLVTEPNARIAWGVGTTRQVQWDVAGTNTIPGAANVDIHLSTDGGLTYPTLLLANTPNDGVAPVSVPDQRTTTARARVQASGNVFFDISNTDFTIASAGAEISIAGTALEAENCTPANEALDAGETVTLSFTLRNGGAGATGSLVATLESSGGVTSPSGSQNYGSIAFEGTATRSFTFTVDPALTCGGQVTTTLVLTDGGTPLGTATATFVAGQTNIVDASSNTAPITVDPVAGVGPGQPYPSPITVSGFSTPVTKVTVTLRGVTLNFSDDHDILLVGPRGQSVILMSDAGGNSAPNNVTYTFDSAAAAPMQDAAPNLSGTYRPSNFGGADAFPGAATAPPYGSTLTAFNNIDPNGTWNLYWIDDAATDGGTIAGGWTLTISSVQSACCSLTGPGSLAFQTSSFSTAENGGGTATITVRRSGGIRGIVGVNYATSDGTASAGSDYTATSGTLLFADGQETATFTIPITNDTTVEPNETVSLTLTAPTGGATLGTPSTATLTILDDDAPAIASLTRGPYLQMADHDSIVVRWRTSVPTDSTVRYGLSSGSLDQQVSDLDAVTDHEVMLTGLSPATTWFYSIGTATRTLETGDFVTAPLPGSAQPTRIWAFGDSGNANANQLAVRDSYVTFDPMRRINVWLLLGDNAYQAGSDSDYQNTFFTRFPTFLKTTPVWSTFGNHDGISSNSATQTGPYYQMFTWPAMGQIGGAPSSTEAYYSFDYANVHFISLNSHDILDRSQSGPMMTWLRNDLIQNQQQWTIAFFHHPPYSFGGHNSDNPGGTQDTPESAASIKEMRENALPILEQYGVDLVLTGHSHDYERSFLLNGHYGLSPTLTEAMKIDRGDGRIGGDGAYRKTSAVGNDANRGAVYAVVGTASAVTPVTRHPVMITAQQRLGSLVIDVNGTRLDGYFLGKENAPSTAFARFDEFTILKGYPLAVDDQVSTPLDTPVTIDVLGNDSDAEGDRIFVSVAPVVTAPPTPSNGTVTLDAGIVTYTPDTGFFGVDSFTYQISDSNGNTDEGEVAVTVVPPAGLVRWENGSYTTSEASGSVNLTVTRVDGSQGNLTVTYTTADGTATAPGDYTSGTGTVTFADGETSKSLSINITNDTGTESPEVFTVALSNQTAGGIGSPSVASVTIIDDDVPCAPKPIGSFTDDFEPAPEAGWTVDTAENEGVLVPPWTHVNDPNAHSATHSYFSAAGQVTKDDRLVSPPQSISSTSQLKFWHSYKLEENYDGGVLEVSLDGTNWSVVPNSAFISGPYTGTISLGDAWTGESPAFPAMNEVIADVGAYAGTAVRFRWRLSCDSNIGEVGWYVDDVMFTNLDVPGDPPVAADDSAATEMNTAVTITVLTNDTDPDGGTLTVRESSGGTNGGTTVVNADNTITYTPANGFTGTDTFTYTAENESDCIDIATVTVTINPPPTPSISSLSPTPVCQGSPAFTLTVSGTNFVASSVVQVNGTDRTTTFVSATELTAEIPASDLATAGSLTLGVVNPGPINSNTASLTVAALPVAADDTAGTELNTAVTITVLTNDTDPDGGALTVRDASAGTNGGTTLVNADNTITYTPANGFTGTDTFTYTAENASGCIDVATVTVTINPPPTPSISSLSPTSVCQGSPAFTLTVSGTNFVAGSVVQVNGTDRTTTFVSATDLTAEIPASDLATAGSLTLGVVNPGPINSNTASLTVSALPVGVDDTAGTDVDTAVTITVLTNDTDPDGGALTVRDASAGTNGGTTLVNADNTITYTPANGFTGTDTFTYTAENASGCIDVATVTITVTAGNQAPVAADDAATTPMNVAVNVNVLANDTGNNLNVPDSTTPANGTATCTFAGVCTYTPNASFVGVDTFSYTVSDYNASDTGLVTVTVTGPMVAAALVVDPAGNSVLEPGESVLLQPSWRNTDVNPAALTGSGVSFTGPSGLTYTIVDGAANYGTIAAGSTVNCATATSGDDCYTLGLSAAATRPVAHWDGEFQEMGSTGTAHTWSLHIGDSFTDVPRSYLFYRQIETLLHESVTLGCGDGSQYCKDAPTSRRAMAAFIARAELGSDAAVPSSGTVGTNSYNCTAGGNSLFSDVSTTETFCKHIHYIASQNITAGCGDGTTFCPADNVTRLQMAIFLARARAGSDAAVPTAFSNPANGRSYDLPNNSRAFTDLVGSQFEKHANYLWALGVTDGCTATTYCPSSLLTRGQMAKFLVGTYEMVLYKP